MSSKPAGIPTYSNVIREVLSTVNGTIAVSDLLTILQQKRPSQAKNPEQSIRQKIREQNGRQLIFVDREHVLPLWSAFQGARFRIRLRRQQIKRAELEFFTALHDYLPQFFDAKTLKLIDEQGNLIPFKVKETGDISEEFILLTEWFHSQRFGPKDHLLITIEDWEKGVLRLQRQRYQDQSADLIAQQNQHFADSFYQLLEEETDEYIWAQVALATVYARLEDKKNVWCPDHWAFIVDHDPRMRIRYMNEITYADSDFTPIEYIFAQKEGVSLLPLLEPFTRQEGCRVYRMQVKLADKPSIWREIEIQGNQTLSELDRAIREAFEHDMWDHLSGFWKLVPRGGAKTKRYRKVELGTVNPFEESECSDTALAALKLQTGDALLYVCDFGDWIEHVIQIKSIGDPEPDVQYPRQVARNKPRYMNCVECEKNGKQVIAAWICYSCSASQQRDVVLCGDCLIHHEEHHVDKLLY
mgnify:CR=1 FL=1